MRLGFSALTPSDIDLLRSRCVSDENVHPDVLHAYHSNAEVADYNNRMLNKIDKPLMTIRATIKAPLGLANRVSKSEDGRVGKTAFVEYLNVKVGARVKLIYNVWTFDGLVNGAMGNIVGIYKRPDGYVEFIAVEFDNPRTGTNQRLKYPRCTARFASKGGTPIFMHEMSFDLSARVNSGQGTVTQFPLKLGWAQTSHSLQVKNISQ